MIKFGDVIISVVIVLSAVVLFMFNILSGSKGQTVRITVDGKTFKEMPIDSDCIERVETEHGANVIEVKDGKVRVTEADCPDRYCVNHVAIETSDETIVCLPHRMVVRIVGDYDD